MHFLKTIVALMSVFLSAAVLAGPVNINTADADSIAAAIDGVGERKAVAIVEYRDTHGPFNSVDELARVKGIGEKTVERNRDNLTVSATAD